MDETAWPFLIGRTKTEDHRIVVIPEFMTDPALASALRSTASGDPMEPGSAAVREIQVAQDTDITVVYRVSIARAEAYGVPVGTGTGVLTDSHGRPILITEGLVLRRAASDVMTSGLPRAAMDQAHALVAPAYLEFWSDERQFTRQVGHAFPVAANNSPGVLLRRGPAATTVASTPPRARPALSRRGSVQPLLTGAGPASMHTPADQPQPPAHMQRYRRRPRAVVWVLAILILVAVGLVAFQIFSPRSAPRDATQTMSAFCSDLRAGHSGAAYSLTTKSYQARTMQSAFTTELLSQGTAAIQCEYALQGSSGKTTTDATLNIGQGNASRSWRITLTGSASTSWQISAISHAN